MRLPPGVRKCSFSLRVKRRCMADRTDRTAKIKAVIRVAAGNFLEMYDFMVFGYYAAAIGRAFFPKTSEFASLMYSLATFGVGFLMRPLGAVVLGGLGINILTTAKGVMTGASAHKENVGGEVLCQVW